MVTRVTGGRDGWVIAGGGGGGLSSACRAATRRATGDSAPPRSYAPRRGRERQPALPVVPPITRTGDAGGAADKCAVRFRVFVDRCVRAVSAEGALRRRGRARHIVSGRGIVFSWFCGPLEARTATGLAGGDVSTGRAACILHVCAVGGATLDATPRHADKPSSCARTRLLDLSSAHGRVARSPPSFFFFFFALHARFDGGGRAAGTTRHGSNAASRDVDSGWGR